MVAGADKASLKLDGLFHREQFQYEFPEFCKDDKFATTSIYASFDCIANYPQSDIRKSGPVVAGWPVNRS